MDLAEFDERLQDGVPLPELVAIAVWEKLHGPMEVVTLTCDTCSYTLRASNCMTLHHRDQGLHALVRGWDNHVQYIRSEVV